MFNGQGDEVPPVLPDAGEQQQQQLPVEQFVVPLDEILGDDDVQEEAAVQGEAQPPPQLVAGGQQLPAGQLVPAEGEDLQDVQGGAAVQGDAQPPPQHEAGGQQQQQQQQPPLLELDAEEEAELGAMLKVESQASPRLLQWLAAAPIASEPGTFQVEDLPWPCLQQVMLAKQDEKSKFMDFHHLLVPGRGIMEVMVSQAPSSVPEEEANSMYDLICHKIAANCGGSLKRFSLHKISCYCYLKFWMEPQDWESLVIERLRAQQQQRSRGGPSAASMHAMLRCLPLLRKLYLDAWTAASDETLHVIGDTCTDLRRLAISGPHITGAGLKYLCGRCKKLELLYLENSPHVSTADLRHVLACCPRLEELYHPEAYNALQLAVREAEETPPPNYQLNTLECKFSAGDLPFERIHGSVPFLRYLRAENVSDLEVFSKKEKMKEMILCFNAGSTAKIKTQLPQFLTSLKDSELTFFAMFTKNESGPLQVDLSKIGEAMPNLKHLIMRFGFTFTFRPNLQIKNHNFSQLESIVLLTHNLQICELHENLWVQIFSSERIGSVLVPTMSMSPEVFSRVAAAAAAAGRKCVFPHLEYLHFYASGGWSTRQMTELLVSRAPKLQHLFVLGLDPSTKAQCEKLFKKYRPNLQFN